MAERAVDLQALLESVSGLVLMEGVFGSHHAVLTSPEQCPIPAFSPLVKLWFSQVRGGVPDFANFDVLDIPPALWSHLILLKTVGPKRRFFYELVGDAIESHNGFPANKRYLADLPLKNKTLMAREFARTLRCGRPVFSTGAHIGQADYVRRVYRLIAPYALPDNRHAFVALAFFTPIAGQEKRLEDATFAVPDALANLPVA